MQFSSRETMQSSTLRQGLHTGGAAPLRPAAPCPTRRGPAKLRAREAGSGADQVLRVNEHAVDSEAREGWDPEGLFKSVDGRPGGWIATRQEARRKAMGAVSPKLAVEDQASSFRPYLKARFCPCCCAALSMATRPCVWRRPSDRSTSHDQRPQPICRGQVPAIT